MGKREGEDMEYVEQLLSKADFSAETDLMATLRTKLFTPVRGITLDELMKKSGIGKNAGTSTKKHERTSQRIKEDTLTRKPPKMDGPRM